jgi:hypothetical protein
MSEKGFAWKQFVDIGTDCWQTYSFVADATAPERTSSHSIIYRQVVAVKKFKCTGNVVRRGCENCKFYKVETFEFDDFQYGL